MTSPGSSGHRADPAGERARRLHLDAERQPRLVPLGRAPRRSSPALSAGGTAGIGTTALTVTGTGFTRAAEVFVDGIKQNYELRLCDVVDRSQRPEKADCRDPRGDRQQWRRHAEQFLQLDIQLMSTPRTHDDGRNEKQRAQAGARARGRARALTPARSAQPSARTIPIAWPDAPTMRCCATTPPRASALRSRRTSRASSSGWRRSGSAPTSSSGRCRKIRATTTASSPATTSIRTFRARRRARAGSSTPTPCRWTRASRARSPRRRKTSPSSGRSTRRCRR